MSRRLMEEPAMPAASVAPSASSPVIAVLEPFRRCFREPTWRRVQVVLIGVVLARGRRTVTTHRDGGLAAGGTGGGPAFQQRFIRPSIGPPGRCPRSVACCLARCSAR